MAVDCLPMSFFLMKKHRRLDGALWSRLRNNKKYFSRKISCSVLSYIGYRCRLNVHMSLLFRAVRNYILHEKLTENHKKIIVSLCRNHFYEPTWESNSCATQPQKRNPNRNSGQQCTNSDVNKKKHITENSPIGCHAK